MNKYLEINDVQVFPFGKTRRQYPNARVLNEQNITNLVNMIADKKSYVVSFDDSTKILEFVINGYYFRADLTTLCEEFINKNIYAYITLNDSNGYSYLSGGDQVTTVSEGDGTSEHPFILNNGRFEMSINNMGTYFTYEFKQNGTIVIYSDESILLESSSITPSEDETKQSIKIEGNTGDKVIFSIRANEGYSVGNLAIDVIHSGVFTGVQFTDKEFDTSENQYKLHILEPYDDTHQIPADSCKKFYSSSISGLITDLDIDIINCGTASENI